MLKVLLRKMATTVILLGALVIVVTVIQLVEMSIPSCPVGTAPIIASVGTTKCLAACRNVTNGCMSYFSNATASYSNGCGQCQRVTYTYSSSEGGCSLEEICDSPADCWLGFLFFID